MRILIRTLVLVTSLFFVSQTGHATDFSDERGSDQQSVQMERYNQLKALVESFEKDFEKYCVKGNQAAGVRVRKHMQELRRMAQDIRVEVAVIRAHSNNPDEEVFDLIEDESESLDAVECYGTGCGMETYNQLLALVESFEKDFEKFFVKGNDAAGVRVRRHMQELRKMAQCIIQMIQQGSDDEQLEELD